MFCLLVRLLLLLSYLWTLSEEACPVCPQSEGWVVRVGDHQHRDQGTTCSRAELTHHRPVTTQLCARHRRENMSSSTWTQWSEINFTVQTAWLTLKALCLDTSHLINSRQHCDLITLQASAETETISWKFEANNIFSLVIDWCCLCEGVARIVNLEKCQTKWQIPTTKTQSQSRVNIMFKWKVSGLGGKKEKTKGQQQQQQRLNNEINNTDAVEVKNNKSKESNKKEK